MQSRYFAAILSTCRWSGCSPEGTTARMHDMTPTPLTLQSTASREASGYPFGHAPQWTNLGMDIGIERLRTMSLGIGRARHRQASAPFLEMVRHRSQSGRILDRLCRLEVQGRRELPNITIDCDVNAVHESPPVRVTDEV